MSEKPKPTYLFLTLHKAHPSPTPLQNLKLHHSSILTPQKEPREHPLNRTSPYSPKKNASRTTQKSDNRLSFNTITEKQMTKETIQPESETQRTILKASSCKERYAKRKNLHRTFLISIEVCEKKFGRIFATVPESPPFLSNRSLAPYPQP